MYVGLNKNVPSIDLYIWILGYQRVELFGRIRRIRRCGLVGRSVSLAVSFEDSRGQARLSVVSLLVCGSGFSS